MTSPANVSLNWPAGDRRVQSLVIDPAKGTFHGGFSHSVLTFTVPFEGLLVHFIGGSPEYAAHGYFLYPQAGNSSPVPSATFAQLLSGRVTITPIPPTLP